MRKPPAIHENLETRTLGAKRRKISDKTVGMHGKDVFWSLHVLEKVRPEIRQFDAGWKAFRQQVCGGCAYEYLPAMPDGEQPSTSIEGRAEIVTIALLGVACVESRPHTKRRYNTPILGFEPELNINGCIKCSVRQREGNTKGIACRGEHRAMVLSDDPPHNGVMGSHGLLHHLGM